MSELETSPLLPLLFTIIVSLPVIGSTLHYDFLRPRTDSGPFLTDPGPLILTKVRGLTHWCVTDSEVMDLLLLTEVSMSFTSISLLSGCWCEAVRRPLLSRVFLLN